MDSNYCHEIVVVVVVVDYDFANHSRHLVELLEQSSPAAREEEWDFDDDDSSHYDVWDEEERAINQMELCFQSAARRHRLRRRRRRHCRHFQLGVTMLDRTTPRTELWIRSMGCSFEEKTP